MNQNSLKSRSFIFDLSSITTLFILGQILSFLTGILTARHFGPQGKGEIAVLFLTASYMTSVFTFGTEFAFLAIVGKKRDELGYYTLVSLGLVGLLGLCGFMVAVPVVRYTLKTSIYIPIFIATAVLFNVLYLIVSSSFYISGRILEESFLNRLGAVLSLIAAIIVFCFNGSLVFFIGSYALSSVLRFGYGLFLLKKYHIITEFSLKIDWKIWKEMMKFGLKVQPSTILKLSANKFDYYIVSYLLGVYSVGLYSVSVGLSAVILLMSQIMGVLIQQRAAVTGESEGKTLMTTIHRMTSFSLLLAVIALAFTGKWLIIFLYGETFKAAYIPFLCLLPGIWTWGMWKNLTNELVSQGYPGHVSISTVLAVTLTVILDFLLIPHFGLKAAALVSSLSYFLAFIYIVIFYSQKKKIPLSYILVPNLNDFQLISNRFLHFFRRISRHAAR